MIFQLLGSLGLFLIGMWLMTEGLKLAGGKALEQLLGRWTSSRLRALCSGTLITALVQSSGAVTVATMGFISAGLMTFPQALWVAFGSNVGTTFTAWIVTFFGFSLDISTYTFPLVGIGAGMRVFIPNERGKALGTALAGFGLLFFGIESLSQQFSSHAASMPVGEVLANSHYPLLIAILTGFVMTVLTQSSSAAIAIILTAVASGVVGLEVAAGGVIGANVGSTSTALMAAIGTSADSKRLAYAHVAFNLLTAVVVIAILPVFWPLVRWIGEHLPLGNNPMVQLSLFHTCFNLLGILLMVPTSPLLTRFLLSLHRKPGKDPNTVPGIDPHIANIPDLAIRTMTIELGVLRETTAELALPDGKNTASAEAALSSICQRIENLNRFITLSMDSVLTRTQGNQLTLGLAVNHHLHYACRTFADAVEDYHAMQQELSTPPSALVEWFAQVNHFSHMTIHMDAQLATEELAQLQKQYQETKMRLLSAAGSNTSIAAIDLALQAASLARRYVEQLLQANEAFRQLAQPAKP